jgi:hypothetical protein
MLTLTELINAFDIYSFFFEQNANETLSPPNLTITKESSFEPNLSWESFPTSNTSCLATSTYTARLSAWTIEMISQLDYKDGVNLCLTVCLCTLLYFQALFGLLVLLVYRHYALNRQHQTELFCKTIEQTSQLLRQWLEQKEKELKPCLGCTRSNERRIPSTKALPSSLSQFPDPAFTEKSTAFSKKDDTETANRYSLPEY